MSLIIKFNSFSEVIAINKPNTITRVAPKKNIDKIAFIKIAPFDY